MDVGAFVQENKRWLLGCAIGVVVWQVAGAVVGATFAAAPPSARALGAPSGEVYDDAALAAARDENERLLAERQRLQRELAFVPTPRYLLAGKGAADEYLFQVGRELRQKILAAANERDVQIAETSITWDVPGGVDEIRATLLGLELVDEVQRRLFAAHDAARAAAPDSQALRGILALKLESRRGQRAQPRSSTPGTLDVRDVMTQERVAFQFQADEAVLSAFLESCRQPGRTLVIEAWQVLKPARPGEPCSVKGSLQGIVWKEG